MSQSAKSDSLILTLFEKSIKDADRKDLYTRALPRMTAEQKLRMLTELLQYTLVMLEDESNGKIEAKFAELYNSQDDSFTLDTFEEIVENTLLDFIGETETSSVSTMANIDANESLHRAHLLAEKLKALAEEVRSLAHH